MFSFFFLVVQVLLSSQMKKISFLAICYFHFFFSSFLIIYFFFHDDFSLPQDFFSFREYQDYVINDYNSQTIKSPHRKSHGNITILRHW